MKSEVKLILASEHKGTPIYTFQLRYWRAIHGEVMTHRVFSRNASSSRAIPIEKMIDTVLQDTAGPESWGTNQKGMQAGAPCNAEIEIPMFFEAPLRHFLSEMGQREEHWVRAMTNNTYAMSRETAWKFAAWLSTEMSRSFAEAGYHKQIANRITEPYQYINVVVTATDWDNFFALRCHPDAMPEFQSLATEIRQQMQAAKCNQLQEGEWHIPYLNPEDQTLSLKEKLAISVSRCASVSYKTVDGQPMTAERAIALYDKLAGADPIHASPLEHQAMASNSFEPDEEIRLYSNLSFPWQQYRKFIENNLDIS